jgi:WhiB family transcriptional regulator, redox-sensing transcriptional regulator
MLTRPDRTGQPAGKTTPAIAGSVPWLTRLSDVADMSGERDWRLRAACRGVDSELFFPEGSRGPALESAASAKQICAACPVRARCLDWALTHGAHHGVWGGRTEDERRSTRATSSVPHPRVRRSTWTTG